MRVVTAFPRAVREIEHCWIPLRDGRRLAARLWLPADAMDAPVPAILEYIPYRKRDLTRTRDEPMHRYFAGHGYAAARVDVCGAGDSDGVLLDEYHEQELEEGVAVIEWLAAQPWCTGAVGMMGKSWGGFNALQIAARRPDALRAIITVCSSDDRYADDAHYMGGCLLNENLTWGSVLQTLSALPPDPAVVGDGWRETWLARLRSEVLFPEVWLRHQRRDAYWRRGSVCEDFARITCPVYAIGGWADAYTNAVPRLLAGLRSARKGLVGPWSHNYPHDGAPGPAIGFLQEARRWWDHWLKGIDTGIMDEPAYRVWMQESAPPASWYAERFGRWVAKTKIESRGAHVAHHDDAVPAQPRPTRRVLHPGVAPRVAVTRDARARGGRVVQRRSRGRGARRSTRGRCRLTHIRLRAARRAARDSRGSRRGPGAHRRSTDGPRRRAAERGVPRRVLRPRDLWLSEPHPPIWARGPRAARARSTLRRATPAARRRARVRPGSSGSPRPLDELLADRLAVARGGHARRVHRFEPSRAARPAAVGR